MAQTLRKEYVPEWYVSFQRVYGYILALVAFLFAFVAWIFSPTIRIPIYWVILAFVILFVALATFVDLSIRLYRIPRSPLPKVRATKPSPGIEQSPGLLILEPSDLFSTDAIVSIYRKKNEIESLLAVGYVLTVQENGLIQVVVLPDPTNDQHLSEDLAKGNAEFCQELLVKPHVPKIFFDRYKP